MYVVESGHIRIFKSSSGGREHVLSVDGPGSSVAELPVFDGGNYPASAAAVDDATLLFVSKQDFHALSSPIPRCAQSTAGRGRTLAAAGWDHRRALVYDGASPARVISF